MSRYLRPGVCLDCGNGLAGLEVCPRCGLAQVGPDADALRSILAQADDRLQRIRALRASPEPLGPAACPPAPARLPAPSLEPERQAALRPVVAAPQQSAAVLRAAARLPALSGSAVLLGLGALCVAVAAVVFVSVTWSDLSLAARAAILLAVTAAVGGVAALAVRRGLRGSAEVFAVLFAGLVAVDFLAAHFGDLAGLGNLSWSALGWTAAALLLAAGGGWAIVGARSPLNALIGAQAVAVLGLGGLTAMAFSDWPLPAEYTALVCVAALVGAALLARTLALRGMAAGAVLVAALCFGVAVVTSLSRLVAADTPRELWLGNGAYGWLICCALVGAVALVRRLPAPSRIVAAAVALAGVTAVLVRPAEEARPDVSAAVLVTAALILAGFWMFRGGIWGQGARIAAVLPALAALRLMALPVAEVVAKCVSVAATPWSASAYARPGTLGLYAAITPVVTAVLLAALAVVGWLLLLRRLPSVPSAVVVITSAAALGALGYDVPLAAVVGVLLVVAVLTAALARWRRSPLAQGVFLCGALLALLAAAGSVA